MEKESVTLALEEAQQIQNQLMAGLAALSELRLVGTYIPGEPGYAAVRPQPRKSELVRLVRERADAKRAARKLAKRVS